DTDHAVAANYLTTFSSGTINEARVQYTRSRLGSAGNDTIGPAVSISGVAAFGNWTSSPTARDADVVEGIDTLTLQRGSHLIKTRADVLYNRINITFPGATAGSYTFTSLANFQRGAYSQFQQAFGQTSLLQSNPNLGVFAQDEWRPRGDLTINAGLRYDVQWLPSPINPDRNNVSPRIGAAYAPADGKTVYRASGGVYFDRVPLRATSNAIQRDGRIYQTAVLSAGQPKPSVANSSQYASIGDSWFSGATASVETRGLRWGRIRVSFTLSKSEDDAGNAFFQTPQTQNDVLADKGPSDTISAAVLSS